MPLSACWFLFGNNVVQTNFCMTWCGARDLLWIWWKIDAFLPKVFWRYILKEAPHIPIKYLHNNENSYFAQLNFHIIVLDTVESILNPILEFHQTEGVDLKLRQLLNDDTLSTRLILNSDSRELIESLAKVSAWPLWAAIADLPPIKRAAFRNMVLCSLFSDRRKLDFQKVFDHFLKETAQGCTIQSTTKTYKVDFNAILIIADLIAKAKILNKTQYNGYYGCSMCLMPEFRVRRARVYPHSEQFQMMTPSKHIKLTQEPEQGKIQHDTKRSEKRYQAVRWVLGGGKIYELLPNLPLTVTIHKMHQLYVGIVDEFLSFSYNSVEIPDKTTIDKALGDLKSTCELKRILKPLRCLAILEANILKTYLLYLAPMIFRPFLLTTSADSDLDDLIVLVQALRHLSERSNNLEKCGGLFEKFCQNMALKYPEDKF